MNEAVRAETFPLQKINPASSLPVITLYKQKDPQQSRRSLGW
ncbi:MAG: hypothetical protein JWM14_103 [Chitinophagaceae bacterium]|nr:hypothetical protein [Chitinophagaceae bacterium]